MRIIIVGGTGYVGSRVFLSLKENHSVDTVDLEWFGNFINPSNLQVDYCQLTEEFLQKYDVIILFAGHSSVPMCLNRMMPSLENNVYKFVDILTKIGDKKFIYASSSSVYGNTMDFPATETWDRFNPSNLYDLSKKVIELYAQIHGKRVYGLRMGTLSGWSPNLRVDIMVNKMYDTARRFGNINVFNLEVYRPVLGMDDMCRAISSLVETDGEPGLYNLASFNANVDEISQSVADSIGNVDIILGDSCPTYNFSIDTKKFVTNFKFQFRDSVQSIVNSLRDWYDKCNKNIRV